MLIHKIFKKRQERNSKNLQVPFYSHISSTQYKEAHWRSLAKGISWRITGSLDTLLLSWVITGKFTFAISIASAEIVTKIILFYIHERIWNKIQFGKKIVPPPDYQI